MENLTKFWLADVIAGPVLLIVFTILLSILSIVWTLAVKTFKKFPWKYLWIFTISFLHAVRVVWREFPRVWLREFKDRKEKWRRKNDTSDTNVDATSNG